MRSGIPEPTVSSMPAAAPQNRWPDLFPKIVAGIWAIVGLVVIIRGALASHKHSVIHTYLSAGHDWFNSLPLYQAKGGFVYSPLIAALFSPLSLLPEQLSHPLWLAAVMAIYAVGIFMLVRSGLFSAVDERVKAWVFLLALPISIGNFNNGQVNPIVIALLVLAITSMQAQRYWIAALAAALATHMKLYPAALGMVLMAVYPREFSWRFVLAVLGLAALTFLLQRPSYVYGQYCLWFTTRAGDHRDEEGIVRNIFQIFAALHLPLGQHIQTLLQAGSGAAIAAVAFIGRFRFRWSKTRVLVTILCRVDAWMLLFGPATESATYVMLAPVAACGLVQSVRQPLPVFLKVLTIGALSLLTMGAAINSFLSHAKTPLFMSVQPAGALLFAVFALIWTAGDKFWSTPAPVSQS